jgi:hypothetical protein
MAQPAVGGVELKQVRQRSGVGHVVDRHDLQIFSFQGSPRERAANPAEAVNSYPYRHYGLLSDAVVLPRGRPAEPSTSMTSITSLRSDPPTALGLFHGVLGP